MAVANTYSIDLYQGDLAKILGPHDVRYTIREQNPSDALEVFSQTILNNPMVMKEVGQFCMENDCEITLVGPKDAMNSQKIEETFYKYRLLENKPNFSWIDSRGLTLVVRKHRV